MEFYFDFNRSSISKPAGDFLEENLKRSDVISLKRIKSGYKLHYLSYIYKNVPTYLLAQNVHWPPFHHPRFIDQQNWFK